MFLAQITATLLDVTNPDSSIQKPAAINITKSPANKNKSVLNIKLTSGKTVVFAKASVGALIRDSKIAIVFKIFIF